MNEIEVHPIGSKCLIGPIEQEGKIENATISRHGVVEYEVSFWADDHKHVMPCYHDEVEVVPEIGHSRLFITVERYS